MLKLKDELVDARAADSADAAVAILPCIRLHEDDLLILMTFDVFAQTRTTGMQHAGRRPGGAP